MIASTCTYVQKGEYVKISWGGTYSVEIFAQYFKNRDYNR